MTQRLRTDLTIDDYAMIETMRLRHIMYMPEIQSNLGLWIALAERWHFETCTFHLSTSEMSITLEDVYRILQIPIHKKLFVYDREGDVDALR